MFEMSLATVEDRHIYKIGGTQSDEKFCNRYDIQTDTWHTAPSLSAVRRRHSNCVLAGVLYVFGGHNAFYSRFLLCIEILDCISDITRNNVAWQ